MKFAKLSTVIVLGILAFSVGLGIRFVAIDDARGFPASLRTADRLALSAAAATSENTGVVPVSSPVSVVSPQDLSEPSIAISPDLFYTLEEILYIEGRSVPQGIVSLQLTKQGEPPVKFITKADSQGEWVVAEKVYLSQGDWTVRARTQFRDQISDFSNPRIIRSVANGVNLFGFKIRYVVIAIVLIIFFVTIALILGYFFHRIQKLKRGLFEKQLKETGERFRQNFAEIRRDLTDELRTLAENAANRSLTPDEITRREHILRELDATERQMTDEMGEIGKKF